VEAAGIAEGPCLRLRQRFAVRDLEAGIQMNSRQRKKAIDLLHYVLTILACLMVLAPILWMVSTSFKTAEATASAKITWLPSPPTTEAYKTVWTQRDFFRYMANSLRVSVATTVLAVILAGLAGYGFSRFRFRGHSSLLLSFLITQMFPGAVLIIPYFMVMRNLRLINSPIALILAFTSFALPFSTWMLKGFFDSIPHEIDESALVDGCNRFQVCYRIMLPIAAPGVAATMLFAFILSWNQYLFALVLTTNERMYTLPVGIASLVGEYWIAWNELMAAGVIAIIPSAIAFMFVERYLVEGLTAGAVKE